jgi:hypothetical protein
MTKIRNMYTRFNGSRYQGMKEHPQLSNIERDAGRYCTAQSKWKISRAFAVSLMMRHWILNLSAPKAGDGIAEYGPLQNDHVMDTKCLILDVGALCYMMINYALNLCLNHLTIRTMFFFESSISSSLFSHYRSPFPPKSRQKVFQLKLTTSLFNCLRRERTRLNRGESRDSSHNGSSDTKDKNTRWQFKQISKA